MAADLAVPLLGHESGDVEAPQAAAADEAEVEGAEDGGEGRDVEEVEESSLAFSAVAPALVVAVALVAVSAATGAVQPTEMELPPPGTGQWSPRSSESQAIVKVLQKQGTALRRSSFVALTSQGMLAIAWLWVGLYTLRLPASAQKVELMDNNPATCDRPFAMWYIVEGGVAALEALGTTAFRLGTGGILANSDFAKGGYYAAQDRKEEARTSMQKALPDVRRSLVCAAAGCFGMCGMFTFDLGWLIYGLSMIFQSHGRCEAETSYFWYLVGARIIVIILGQMASRAVGPNFEEE